MRHGPDTLLISARSFLGAKVPNHLRCHVGRVAKRCITARPAICAPATAPTAVLGSVERTGAVARVALNRASDQGRRDLLVATIRCNRSANSEQERQEERESLRAAHARAAQLVWHCGEQNLHPFDCRYLSLAAATAVWQFECSPKSVRSEGQKLQPPSL